MGLKEQQNFMARLFTDEGLRHSFLGSPEKIATQNGLSESDISALKGLLPKELDFFAESLIHKRLHEVEKMLPLTVQALGKKKFGSHFEQFAETLYPETIKKHLEDSVKFSAYLLSKHLDKPWQKDVINFERAGILFHGYERRFTFKIMRYDFLSPNSEERLRKEPWERLTFMLWIRVGKWKRHFAW